MGIETEAPEGSQEDSPGGAGWKRARSPAIGRLAASLGGLGLVALAVVIFETAARFGLGPLVLAPLVGLAMAGAAYIAGALGSIPALLAGGMYLLRVLEGSGTLGRPLAGLATGAAVLVIPALALRLRKAYSPGMPRRSSASGPREPAASAGSGAATPVDAWEALDTLEALYWEAAPQAETVRFRNSFAQVFIGYPADDEGRLELPWTIVHPDDRKRHRMLLDAVAADGRTRHLEYRIQARDGFDVWIRDTIRLVGGSGPGARLQGIAVNISARKAIEEDLYREKERYRSLFEGVPVGLYRMTPQGEFLAANTALVHLFGYSNHHSFYATHADAIYADPMDRWRWQNALVHTHGVRSFELPCRRLDGSLLWVRNTARAVRSESGEIAYYEVVVEEIPDRSALVKEGADKEFQGLVERSVVGLYMAQAERVVYANPKMAEIFGYTHEELLELPSALDLFAEEHRSRVSTYMLRCLEQDHAEPISFRGRRKDGTTIDVEVHCAGASFRDQPAVLGTLQDVTSRKESEARLFHAAFHDPLTALPNRILFMERVEHAMQRQKRGAQFAVLFLDLNKFKEINDTLGHPAGDEMLRIVGRRLQACLRPGDSISRFGGDEFAMLLEDVRDLQGATLIAERIREAIAAPAEIASHLVYSGASIGIALSSAGYRSPEEILRDADAAMYRAKVSGSSRYAVFDDAMQGEALARVELETELQLAAEGGDFHLHYQPIVCLRTGDFVGAEALVRWTHPDRGPISPSTFLPVAEETGTIIPIGRHVLRTACRQAVEWQRNFPRASPLTVSVNLSMRQIRGSAIVEDVREVLEQTFLPPQTLRLEITEKLILEDRRAAAHMLNHLKALGVRISLDDFGTGYSSLGYLHDLPIDTLKIDRMFVKGLEETGAGPDLVRTIVSVAHNLGMDVVAEGAESEEHVRRLRELGCEFAQGYHFAPPVSAEEIETLLARGRFMLPAPPEILGTAGR